jgi:CRP-like cAMP-binding protein
MGDVFGEVSMLGEGPATATVRALRTAWTLALPRDRFAGVVGPRPELRSFLQRLGESRRAADLPLDAHGALSVTWL